MSGAQRDALRVANQLLGECRVTISSLTSRLDAATRERDALVKAIDTDGSLKTVEACVDAMPDLHHAYGQLAAIEKIEAERDAATRRADEVCSLLREARDAMRALYNDVADERLWDVDATVAKFRKIIDRINAALSTGSTPATTANPGDKAARIDAAKEGR